MYCPRLDHFVRFNPNGTVSRCGHMIDAPKFDSLESMDNSDWMKAVKASFNEDRWPKECNRCHQTEALNGTSIRLNSIYFDKLQKQGKHKLLDELKEVYKKYKQDP